VAGVADVVEAVHIHEPLPLAGTLAGRDSACLEATEDVAVLVEPAAQGGLDVRFGQTEFAPGLVGRRRRGFLEHLFDGLDPEVSTQAWVELAHDPEEELSGRLFQIAFLNRCQLFGDHLEVSQGQLSLEVLDVEIGERGHLRQGSTEDLLDLVGAEALLEEVGVQDRDGLVGLVLRAEHERGHEFFVGQDPPRREAAEAVPLVLARDLVGGEPSFDLAEPGCGIAVEFGTQTIHFRASESEAPQGVVDRGGVGVVARTEAQEGCGHLPGQKLFYDCASDELTAHSQIQEVPDPVAAVGTEARVDVAEPELAHPGREELDQLAAAGEALEEPPGQVGDVVLLDGVVLGVSFFFLDPDEEFQDEVIDIADEFLELLRVVLDPFHAHGAWDGVILGVVDGQDPDDQVLAGGRVAVEPGSPGFIGAPAFAEVAYLAYSHREGDQGAIGVVEVTHCSSDRTLLRCRVR